MGGGKIPIIEHVVTLRHRGIGGLDIEQFDDGWFQAAWRFAVTRGVSQTHFDSFVPQNPGIDPGSLQSQTESPSSSAQIPSFHQQTS